MQTPPAAGKSLTRRQAVGIVGAGGVGLVATLPKKWSKPVIDAVVVPLHAQASGTAITPFASATLGATGSPVGAFPMSSIQFLAVRFVLAAPGVTSNIGIHTVGSGTFFGAVVQLSTLADFPDSLDLSTPDVLGSVVMTFPALSAEVQAPLVLNLSAGTYALIFGSSILGASGTGAAAGFDPNIGTPSYFIENRAGVPPFFYSNGGLNTVRMFIN
jgi:hypothetical protein